MVMRHAHAEPGRAGTPDASRRLTEAGHARAAQQAAVVAAQPPDLVLCSTAVRATETLAHLDTGQAPVHVEVGLYEASATSALLRLAELAEDVGTVLYLGHMPTVAQLVGALIGEASDGVDFAPGTIAVLDVDRTWADLQPGSARLRCLAR
ncbi:histidine phosphatase family protein [soil metagenome]